MRNRNILVEEESPDLGLDETLLPGPAEEEEQDVANTRQQFQTF
jgi:hypothetical protein